MPRKHSQELIQTLTAMVKEGRSQKYIFDNGALQLNESQIDGLVHRIKRKLKAADALPPQPLRTHRVSGQAAASANRVKNAQLKQSGVEPKPTAGNSEVPVLHRARYLGPSTHLSAKEKRERNLVHLDTAEMVGGGAFGGISTDVAKIFAKYYESLA